MKPNRATVPCVCSHCSATFQALPGHINRAKSINAPMYCGRACMGLAKRNPNKMVGEAKKQAKSEYDEKRRQEKGDEIRAQKMAHYYANRERILAEMVIYRAKHMDYHVRYCQQPAYKAWKKEYDRRHNAQTKFGDFAESFLLLQDVEKEIESRATRYEIYQSNGTLNKSQQRKRSL